MSLTGASQVGVEHCGFVGRTRCQVSAQPACRPLVSAGCSRLTVRSTRTRFVASFKRVGSCFIASSRLSWQRVGLPPVLGRTPRLTRKLEVGGGSGWERVCKYGVITV